MASPDVAACLAYLTDAGQSWTEEQVTSALPAELAAQAKACRVPEATEEEPDPEWPADLAEALFRRVAHNLALRALPLGIQATIAPESATTNRVGGTDAEVRRLEAPYRRLVVG